MPSVDSVLGTYAPEIPWVPTIAHIIRRAAIFDALREHPVGRVLEVGCGGGALLHDLSLRGFSGKGVDTSEPALKVARYLHAENDDRIRIDKSLCDADQEHYDYVMAFEVLEHIQDDVGAVREWKRCLKPGGRLIISVPAHRRMWGASDEWAGHVRRYDLADLHGCFNAAGLRIERSYCYGFPLLNVLSPISNLVRKIKSSRRKKSGETSLSDATRVSGVDRAFESRIFRIYSNVLAKLFFRSIFLAQRRFYPRAWGTGYIVVASEQPRPDTPGP